MKKAQHNAIINKAAQVHSASNDDTQVVEDLRAFFCILFVFVIYVL